MSFRLFGNDYLGSCIRLLGSSPRLLGSAIRSSENAIYGIRMTTPTPFYKRTKRPENEVFAAMHYGPIYLIPHTSPLPDWQPHFHVLLYSLTQFIVSHCLLCHLHQILFCSKEL